MPALQTDTITTYYESHGQGQPLLFIHGLGSSTRDWEYQVAFFAPHYRVITYDLRGHGQSDKPQGRYRIPMFADDTAALFSALDLPPAHVVGLSLGGMIAFQLALSAPQLVRTLTIVNSGPELPRGSFWQRLNAFKLYLRRIFIVRVRGMRAMGKTLGAHLLPGEQHAERRRIFVDRWAENDPGAYLRALRALAGWSVNDQLDRITQPTLVLTADQDYTPLSFKEAYAARMPRAQVGIIPEARHLTPVERPEAFNNMLLLFLRQHQQQHILERSA